MGCVSVCGVFGGLCVCGQRSTFTVFAQMPFTLLPEAESLTGLELTICVWLAGKIPKGPPVSASLGLEAKSSTDLAVSPGFFPPLR